MSPGLMVGVNAPIRLLNRANTFGCLDYFLDCSIGIIIEIVDADSPTGASANHGTLHHSGVVEEIIFSLE